MADSAEEEVEGEDEAVFGAGWLLHPTLHASATPATITKGIRKLTPWKRGALPLHFLQCARSRYSSGGVTGWETPA